MADGNKYVFAVAQGTDGLQHVNAVMLWREAGGANRYLRGTVSGATAGGFSRRRVVGCWCNGRPPALAGL